MANQKLSEILNYFSFEKLWQDKRVIIFLVCLLISSILWFLNALSKEYNTSITYPVKYVNVPGNRFLANKPPASFELIVDAHGFTLLRNELNLSFTPIVLDLRRILANAETPDGKTYRVNSMSLINRISSQVSNEISIHEIRPGSFLVILDSLESKKVKVKSNISLEFDPQYNLASPVELIPESVIVTGPGSVVDTLSAVYTETFELEKVKKSISSGLDLAPPENTAVSPQKITLTIPVEEYTEKQLIGPITIKDKPGDAIIRLFPSEIQVSFMVGISRYAGITSNDFEFVADYGGIATGQTSLEVVIGKKPEFITELKYSPQTVEFLIEKE